MNKFRLIVLALSVCFGTAAQSKQDKEEALKLGRKAIELMDKEGKYTESIVLLQKAQKLDPDEITYTYEIGYAYYNMKEYEKAIKAIEDLLDHKNVTDRYFQLIGNCYDYLDKPDLGIEIYKKGLKQFPNSGKLYHELGILFQSQENYNEAVGYWEEGVKAEPAFPSNYYRLTKLFSHTDDRIWSVMYGEMFMNVERNSERTTEISKLLYDMYKESVQISSDTSMTISFASNVISMDLSKGEPKLPFSMTFELIMSASVGINLIAEKEFKMEQMCNTRTNFIDMWYKQGKDKDYPNALFDFQKQLADKGFLESYSHWLLMKGSEDEFTAWIGKNEEQFKKFAEWFSENPMKVGPGNYFVRE